MKRYLLTSLFTLFSLITFAQEATTDYIYCPNGFKVVEVECPYRPGYNDISTCIGLYTADGKTLVQALMCNAFGEYFYVMDGTETIASKAFQYFSGKRVYIPSSVTSIAPDALTCTSIPNGTGTNNFPNRIVGIYNGAHEYKATKAADRVILEEPEAIGTYGVDGKKIEVSEQGVNLVRMSDGSTKKIMVIGK